VFGQLFREADTENIGVVTGEVAVKFFEKTRLEPRILGEVSLPQNLHDPFPKGVTEHIDLNIATNSYKSDLANCRQGESRTAYTCWLWYCSEIDWPLPSR
jgi:hypothetical protein